MKKTVALRPKSSSLSIGTRDVTSVHPTTNSTEMIGWGEGSEGSVKELDEGKDDSRDVEWSKDSDIEANDGSDRSSSRQRAAGKVLNFHLYAWAGKMHIRSQTSATPSSQISEQTKLRARKAAKLERQKKRMREVNYLKDDVERYMTRRLMLKDDVEGSC
ncbi:hypothetical protein NE237_019408 [Protea cynaroides]|uniref:Uncharacterized protein n=1 Tax=Protea cynaroides TaxID=273540 RepID=A0A9Q0QQ33_9MAGN|nr:hypothetical protein NE237_019408 [Protea cynaroides]